MEITLNIIGVTLILELVTIYLRLISHKRSGPLQKKLHMPRIHHSYVGMVALFIEYVYLHSELLFIAGFSLVLSDLIHHLIFEPAAKKFGFDISMRHHRQMHHFVKRVVPTSVVVISLALIGLFVRF